MPMTKAPTTAAITTDTSALSQQSSVFNSSFTQPFLPDLGGVVPSTSVQSTTAPQENVLDRLVTSSTIPQTMSKVTEHSQSHSNVNFGSENPLPVSQSNNNLGSNTNLDSELQVPVSSSSDIKKSNKRTRKPSAPDRDKMTEDEINNTVKEIIDTVKNNTPVTLPPKKALKKSKKQLAAERANKNKVCDQSDILHSGL